jgi:phosphomannomutase
MNKFIFDVDGTLTPSRGLIDPTFKKFFNDFCRDNKVYLVTGSDKPKTVEQIGEDTYNLAHTVYNCSGNDVWQGNKHIRTNEWRLPKLAEYFLNSCLYESKFDLRTGNHIEERPGMVNFSVVGRNANKEEREQYVVYDMFTNERDTIASAFNTMFEDLDARPGGETGIDIAPKGADKSQIITDFDKDDITWFFGDRMDPGGNDYPLAQVVNKTRHVTKWKDTWEYLQIFQEQGITV